MRPNSVPITAYRVALAKRPPPSRASSQNPRRARAQPLMRCAAPRTADRPLRGWYLSSASSATSSSTCARARPGLLLRPLWCPARPARARARGQAPSGRSGAHLVQRPARAANAPVATPPSPTILRGPGRSGWPSSAQSEHWKGGATKCQHARLPARVDTDRPLRAVRQRRQAAPRKCAHELHRDGLLGTTGDIHALWARMQNCAWRTRPQTPHARQCPTFPQYAREARTETSGAAPAAHAPGPRACALRRCRCARARSSAAWPGSPPPRAPRRAPSTAATPPLSCPAGTASQAARAARAAAAQWEADEMARYRDPSAAAPLQKSVVGKADQPVHRQQRRAREGIWGCPHRARTHSPPSRHAVKGTCRL